MRPASFICSLLLALAVSSPALAGELSCDLRIHVRDAATMEPVEATITVTDTRSGWTRTRHANAQGHKTFLGVRPDAGDRNGRGNQRVEVSAPGYVSQSFDGVKCPHGGAYKGRIRLERAL